MNKPRFRLTRFARRNGPVLAVVAALSLLAVMLLPPLVTAHTVSSGTFTNDTLTNETFDSFRGGPPSQQQQQSSPPFDDFNFRWQVTGDATPNHHKL